MTANGYVLAMVGHLKNVSPTLAQLPNRIINFKFTTVSPTIANMMLAVVVMLSRVLFYYFLLSLVVLKTFHVFPKSYERSSKMSNESGVIFVQRFLFR
jgi:hypothetical protein